MLAADQLRLFLIEFNNVFVLDRWYRKAHNIAFNSPEHRNVCQIDVYLEWLENEIFDGHEQDVIEMHKKMQLYEKGEWMSQSEGFRENEEKLFDDIDVTQLKL